MPQRTGVKQSLTGIFYPHKIQSPPQGAKAGQLPIPVGRVDLKPNHQTSTSTKAIRQAIEPHPSIQASKQPRTPYLSTSKIEQAPRPWVLSQKLFIIHRQRESVFLWRNGNEFKTNHHHHQSVACDLLVGAHSLGRASIALR